MWWSVGFRQLGGMRPPSIVAAVFLQLRLLATLLRIDASGMRGATPLAFRFVTGGLVAHGAALI